MRETERRRRCEEIYQLELARGASHIASCITAESTMRSVDEVLQDFARAHGVQDCQSFCKTLANRLHIRGCANAAKLVLEWTPLAQSCAAAEPGRETGHPSRGAREVRRRM
ncbi:hypothetical protein [Paraburkholderia humisilvae]|uniref:Uncharacterized protein n=1 Tax=Paraburkholderia humisilvae TaxID=627669 RepID=A0A6J5DAG9_9BURK|nr:hypothetical protein [Paraburkholderia humisilvae]CAB3751248.1 hypothetical protein LMG29542_01448 [Paraburkholderia humisilvae]